METIEFYTPPKNGIEQLTLSIDFNPAQSLSISSRDQQQIDKDWQERGYTRSSPLGTLLNVCYNPRTRETKLNYILTEYKVYSSLAFPALSDTEEKLSSQLRNSMRASAIGCAVETIDQKIIIQRRKEGLISGGMLDSAAAGMMVYTPSTQKLDWQSQTYEKLARELSLTDLTKINSVKPTSVFSSRGKTNIPAAKGYFTACHSGMVSSLAHVNLSYDTITQIFNKKEVHEIMGIDKKDLAEFIIEHTGPGNRNFCGDGAATMLSLLPEKVFYQTIEKINRKDNLKIYVGSLKNATFTEKS